MKIRWSHDRLILCGVFLIYYTNKDGVYVDINSKIELSYIFVTCIATWQKMYAVVSTNFGGIGKWLIAGVDNTLIIYMTLLGLSDNCNMPVEAGGSVLKDQFYASKLFQ